MEKIYTNGFIKLVCLKGENEKHALFFCLDNLELIGASYVVWGSDGKIHWANGDYKGNITQHLKDSE